MSHLEVAGWIIVAFASCTMIWINLSTQIKTRIVATLANTLRRPFAIAAPGESRRNRLAFRIKDSRRLTLHKNIFYGPAEGMLETERASDIEFHENIAWDSSGAAAPPDWVFMRILSESIILLYIGTVSSNESAEVRRRFLDDLWRTENRMRVEFIGTPSIRHRLRRFLRECEELADRANGGELAGERKARLDQAFEELKNIFMRKYKLWGTHEYQ